MALKRVIGLVFAGSLIFSAAAVDIVIRVAPPRVVAERRAPRPDRNHVWVSGYQQWNGSAYTWTPGRWEQPPRPRAHWVQHRWIHKKGGWVMQEGHWR
jgi:hypothetical protein